MFEIMNMLPMMLAESGITLDSKAFSVLGGVIGCGLVIIGAARGIGGLAGRATEAIARQPEMGAKIFTTMIVAAALIEGVTFFALFICLMAVL